MKEDLHSAVTVEYTPRKIQANIFYLTISSFYNGYVMGETAQMVEQVLCKIFTKGPEFKSWLGRVFL